MKIKILGTAAAEGFPAMFCECEHCEKARRLGGKNLRTRSQALIDDTLLIDFGPDTLFHTMFYGLDLTKVTDLLITHSHRDHLYVSDFENRKKGYCIIKNKKPLNVYGTAASVNKINGLYENNSDLNDVLNTNIIESFKTYKIGEYTVIPLKANHSAQTDPVVYIIQKSGKTFLYSTDTGRYLTETIEFLRGWMGHIDAIAIDCTAILLKNWREHHMGVDTDVEQIEELKSIGVVDENTKVYLHHFSHNGGEVYDDLVPIAAEYGFLVTYDGMEFEI